MAASSDAQRLLGRRLLPIWIVIGAVIVIDVIAFLVVPPPNAYPDISSNFEGVAPHVLMDLGGGSFTITSTIFSSWLVSLTVLGLGVLLTRRLRLVPTPLQNAVEWVYESLANFVVSLGGERARRYASLFITFFLFILLSNWSGVLPFVGKVPWLRAPTSDLNVTVGLALVSFGLFHYEGIRALGARRYFAKFINLSGFKHGPVDGSIDLFVGVLEGLLEFLKPVTLSLRLFGNVWGGEVMLGVMTALLLAVLPLPFLGLELFIGLIQAFIFAILTLIFTVLAVETHEGHVSEAEHVEAAGVVEAQHHELARGAA